MPEDKYLKRKESLRDKKKRARDIRDTKRINSDNSESTHVMEYGEVDGKYVANPTIFPNKGGEWKDLGGKGFDAYEEAKKRGETFEFKRERQARKFAAGSWKEGEDKKKAMKNYMSDKRINRLETKWAKKDENGRLKSEPK